MAHIPIMCYSPRLVAGAAVSLVGQGSRFAGALRKMRH